MFDWVSYRRFLTEDGWRYASPGCYTKRNGDGDEAEFQPHQFKHGTVRWQYLAGLGLYPDGRLLPAPGYAAEILPFIAHYMQEQGRPPSLEEIGDVLGTTKSVVHKRLEQLRDLGWVEWDEGQARTLRLTTDVVLEGAAGRVERNCDTVATIRPVLARCPACDEADAVPLQAVAPGVYQCRHCGGRVPAGEWEDATDAA